MLGVGLVLNARGLG